jgi:hypothetical protein
MEFVQIVEFQTSDIDALRERGRAYEQEMGGDRAGSAMVCADRDNPGRYFIIGRFGSYDDAMKNSEDPRTQALAGDMAKLADGPPTFYNLDVIDEIS